jgi:hypothetical protein
VELISVTARNSRQSVEIAAKISLSDILIGHVLFRPIAAKTDFFFVIENRYYSSRGSR